MSETTIPNSRCRHSRAASRRPAEIVLYRPGFSGHKILLCGRPDWGACGEPFAPGLSRAAVGILLQQPGLVIARDEGSDRGANLLGIAEIRPHTTCSLRVRMNRSATPLVSG